MTEIIQKTIHYFTPCDVLKCDARCDKAWGINNRPKVEFDEDDPDDYAFLADGEVGEAPDDPGTYEGDHAKPTAYEGDWKEHRLNKWCARECERSWIESTRYQDRPRDLSRRSYNIPSLHPEAQDG